MLNRQASRQPPRGKLVFCFCVFSMLTSKLFYNDYCTLTHTPKVMTGCWSYNSTNSRKNWHRGVPNKISNSLIIGSPWKRYFWKTFSVSHGSRFTPRLLKPTTNLCNV